MSRVATLYCLKYPVFNKKNMRQAKEQESMAHTQGKKTQKQSIEIVLGEAQALDFLRKKLAILNMN